MADYRFRGKRVRVRFWRPFLLLPSNQQGAFHLSFNHLSISLSMHARHIRIQNRPLGPIPVRWFLVPSHRFLASECLGLCGWEKGEILAPFFSSPVHGPCRQSTAFIFTCHLRQCPFISLRFRICGNCVRCMFPSSNSRASVPLCPWPWPLYVPS